MESFTLCASHGGVIDKLKRGIFSASWSLLCGLDHSPAQYSSLLLEAFSQWDFIVIADGFYSGERMETEKSRVSAAFASSRHAYQSPIDTAHSIQYSLRSTSRSGREVHSQHCLINSVLKKKFLQFITDMQSVHCHFCTTTPPRLNSARSDRTAALSVNSLLGNVVISAHGRVWLIGLAAATNW